jgi:hypothetical protein
MRIALKRRTPWVIALTCRSFPLFCILDRHSIARTPRQVPPSLTNFTHDFDFAFNNANREPFPLRVSTSWKLSNDASTDWSHLSTSGCPFSLLLFYLLYLSVLVLSHLLQHAYIHTAHLSLYFAFYSCLLSTLFPHNLTSSSPSISTTYWVGTLHSRWCLFRTAYMREQLCSSVWSTFTR